VSVKNAKKLLIDINKKIDKMECRCVTLKGVKNLSRSDLDCLILYANTYIRNDGSFRGLMAPRGNIEEVLKKYGLKGGI